MDFEEKTLKRESKFKGHIFEVAVDEVLLPDGKTAGRELIFHKGAVAVLAVTPEGKIIIVKQYRKAIEAVSYEIPAGKLEVGEAGDEMAASNRNQRLKRLAFYERHGYQLLNHFYFEGTERYQILTTDRSLCLADLEQDLSKTFLGKYGIRVE